jgi:hypothetical protein
MRDKLGAFDAIILIVLKTIGFWENIFGTKCMVRDVFRYYECAGTHTDCQIRADYLSLILYKELKIF